MKFYNIPDSREFFERVLACAGPIQSIEPDGTRRDLKVLAGFMIHSGMAARLGGFEEINLAIENPADIDTLFSYALRMGRERICA